jgi:N-acetylglutamate synthase/N-acetylornithine aminotransferase
VPLGDSEQQRVEDAMREPEIELRLDLGGEDDELEIYFSDLGHEYVSINAEYS